MEYIKKRVTVTVRRKGRLSMLVDQRQGTSLSATLYLIQCNTSPSKNWHWSALSLPGVINFNFLFQSLTRDISYSMENLAIDSLLR